MNLEESVLLGSGLTVAIAGAVVALSGARPPPRSTFALSMAVGTTAALAFWSRHAISGDVGFAADPGLVNLLQLPSDVVKLLSFTAPDQTAAEITVVTQNPGLAGLLLDYEPLPITRGGPSDAQFIATVATAHAQAQAAGIPLVLSTGGHRWNRMIDAGLGPQLVAICEGVHYQAQAFMQLPDWPATPATYLAKLDQLKADWPMGVTCQVSVNPPPTQAPWSVDAVVADIDSLVAAVRVDVVQPFSLPPNEAIHEAVLAHYRP